jgi:exopolysaccharide production protein ExoQ
MRVPRQFLQDAATVFILFMTTGAFATVIVDSPDSQATTNGSPMMWVFWSLLYSIIVMRLIPKYREVAALVRANRFLFAMVAMTVLSTIWSDDPGLTFRRSIALSATTLLGMDFALRYSIREQLRLLSVVLGIFVVLSIVVQVLFPGFVPYLDFGDEAWHGVLSFKNEWARVIVLAAIVALCRPRQTRTDSWLIAGLLFVAVAFVWEANSKGSLIVFMAMLGFFAMYGAVRWSNKRLTIICVAVLAVIIPTSYVIIQNLDSVTAMLGRDATLTGRSKLWELSLESIGRSPIYGYGYVAFWSATSQEAMRIRSELNWDAPHAHNGYIDVALALGLVGLCLYLTAYFVAVRRAIGRIREDSSSIAAWPLAYLVFIFLCQLTESSIVAANSIFWILYITAVCSVTELRDGYAIVPLGEMQPEVSNSEMDVVGDYA